MGKQEFIKSLGGTLKNVRWSWDGVRPDGSVIFIGWEEDTKRTSDKGLKECRILKGGHEANKNPGGKERIRHIQEILENDSVGYLVVATKTSKGKHIAKFDGNLYSVRLKTRGSDVYAVSLGLDSAPTMLAGDDDYQINQINLDSDIPDTEKSQLILARRGQGLFRRRLEYIESGCRLTGVSDRAHLRASHIKSWRDSTNRERLDGNNGLLLAPHVDHLFDRGFISFEDNGKLLVSPHLGMNILRPGAFHQRLNAAP